MSTIFKGGGRNYRNHSLLRVQEVDHLKKDGSLLKGPQPILLRITCITSKDASPPRFSGCFVILIYLGRRLILNYTGTIKAILGRPRDNQSGPLMRPNGPKKGPISLNSLQNSLEEPSRRPTGGRCLALSCLTIVYKRRVIWRWK